MSEIKVNNYQTKPFLSYNMRFLRYVRQRVQTAIAEDVSAVKSRSIYYSNLILRVIFLHAYSKFRHCSTETTVDIRIMPPPGQNHTYQPGVEQGCTYPECQVAMATTFCMVAPNI